MLIRRSRLEDTVTFHLIERVQFPLNPTIYDAEKVSVPCHNLDMPERLSILDFSLAETERSHSLIRRYESPDEYPFFPPMLLRPLLPPLRYPQILHPNTVCVNQLIKEKYIKEILPENCRSFGRKERPEAQENYGSAAHADVACLQALSRRIHFGKFVAESKFQKKPEFFATLIKAHDRTGLDEAITDKEVEKKVLNRLRLKAETYGVDPSLRTNGVSNGDLDMGKLNKMNVDAVVNMYANVVIPLTKVVEVEYLMQRLLGTHWE